LGANFKFTVVLLADRINYYLPTGFSLLSYTILSKAYGTLKDVGTDECLPRNMGHRFEREAGLVETEIMAYYYTFDHLGSVREMCNSSGTIVARYSYDPYGRTTLVSGSNLATFQYAGYYAHQTSGLELAVYRAFDPNSGRWLSRDPVGEAAGTNLFWYVANNAVNNVDPLGLLPPGLPSSYDPSRQIPDPTPPPNNGMSGQAKGGIAGALAAAALSVIDAIVGKYISAIAQCPSTNKCKTPCLKCVSDGTNKAIDGLSAAIPIAVASCIAAGFAAEGPLGAVGAAGLCYFAVTDAQGTEAQLLQTTALTAIQGCTNLPST
jgi:RHS repeat-associated protein